MGTKRKFVVNYLGSDREIFPLNDSVLEYKWKKQKDSLNYDMELSTKLKFGNNSKTSVYDFTYFYGFEKEPTLRCAELNLKIYRRCADTWKLEFEGVMPMNSGEWDLDRCTVSLQATNATSVYDKINEFKEDTEIVPAALVPNLNASPDVSCGYTVSDYDTDYMNTYFGTYNGEFGLYNTTGGTYVKILIPLITVCVLSDGSKNTYVDDNVWVKTRANDTYISGSGYNIYSYPIGGIYNFLYTKSAIFNSYTFIERESPVSLSTFEMPFQSFAILCSFIVTELLIKTGRSSGDEMIRSDFFDWNAKGDTPGYFPSPIPKLPTNLGPSFYPNLPQGYKYMYLPYLPGINYVTGQTNTLTHIHYMPKSNAGNRSAGEWEQPLNTTTFAANQNKITFEDLEKIWATMFNAFWLIDTDGCMRVEHITWFINNSHMYDATSTTNFPLNAAKNKYTYSKIDLPKKEIFTFSQNRDILNGAIIDPYNNEYNTIEYGGVCVNKDEGSSEKTYSIPFIDTDINILNSANRIPGIYDNKGLFLFVVNFQNISYTTLDIPSGSNQYRSIAEAKSVSETLLNVPSLTTYENGHLQWANLIRRYLLDRRVLTSGDNGPDTITFTARTIKSKTQKEILIKNCCEDTEFDPVQALVRTELGNGEIDEAVYNTQTDLITLTLLHD